MLLIINLRKRGMDHRKLEMLVFVENRNKKKRDIIKSDERKWIIVQSDDVAVTMAVPR